MDEEREKIMTMLAEGTITVEEAYQLLEAIEAELPSAPPAATGQTQRIAPRQPAAAGQAGNPFANLTIDQLIQLGTHGVDAEFIRGVRQLGVTPLSFRQLLEMGIHGVDPEFIRGIHEAGLNDLAFDEMLQ